MRARYRRSAAVCKDGCELGGAYLQAQRRLSCHGLAQHVARGQVAQAVLLLRSAWRRGRRQPWRRGGALHAALESAVECKAANSRYSAAQRALILGDCVPLPHPGGPVRGEQVSIPSRRASNKHCCCVLAARPRRHAPTRMMRFSGLFRHSRRRCISLISASVETSDMSMAAQQAGRAGLQARDGARKMRRAGGMGYNAGKQRTTNGPAVSSRMLPFALSVSRTHSLLE